MPSTRLLMTWSFRFLYKMEKNNLLVRVNPSILKAFLFKGPLVNLWPKSKLVESNFFSSVYRYPCIEQTHSIHATQAKRKTTTTTIKHTPNYWPANSLFPRLRAVHRISARALVSCKLCLKVTPLVLPRPKIVQTLDQFIDALRALNRRNTVGGFRTL